MSIWRSSSEPVSELVEAPCLLKNLKTCVIIPVYNNAGTVKDVVRRALKYCKDVIVVDDGSTDGSSDSLSELGAVVVRYERNRGKGYALKTGFKAARDRGLNGPSPLTLTASISRRTSLFLSPLLKSILMPCLSEAAI